MTLAQIQAEAEKHGLRAVEHAPGHFHIFGKGLRVNYWPNSKRQSAYVSGTTAKFERVSLVQAVKMALAPPPVAEGDRKAKRKSHTLSLKRRMIKNSHLCHWCKCSLSLFGQKPNTRKATLEHVIPLHRGGLDQPNNRVLACEPCNSQRGHDMPELKKYSTTEEPNGH